MIGFTPESPLITVTAVGEHDWELQEGYWYTSNRREIHVPAGQDTDFASSPRLTAWLIPPYGRYTPAAITHDRCWRDLCPDQMSYREADQTFLEAMRLLGVPFVQRHLMFCGVRLGALTRRDGWRGWWRDAPLVAVWTLVALPLVALPAVTITVSLLLLAVLEALVWLPLAVARRLSRRPPEQRKYLNPPTVTART